MDRECRVRLLGRRRLTRCGEPYLVFAVRRLAPRRNAAIHILQRGLDFIPFFPVLRDGDEDRGRVLRVVAVHGAHGVVPEECGELEEFFLGERVELVVMAGRAARREAKPDAAHGVHAVGGVDRFVFLGDRAALTGGGEAAEKPGGHVLVECAVGQHVAGELLGGELVPFHVLVESPHHPIAVGPDGAVVVDVDAVRVGVAGGIQPMPGEVLRALDGGEHAVRLRGNGGLRVFFVSGHEGIGLGGLRRQAGQIQREPAVESARVFGGIRRQARLGEFLENEAVDRLIRPIVFHRIRAAHGLIGPVILVFRALLDPSL